MVVVVPWKVSVFCPMSSPMSSTPHPASRGTCGGVKSDYYTPPVSPTWPTVETERARYPPIGDVPSQLPRRSRWFPGSASRNSSWDNRLRSIVSQSYLVDYMGGSNQSPGSLRLSDPFQEPLSKGCIITEEYCTIPTTPATGWSMTKKIEPAKAAAGLMMMTVVSGRRHWWR